MHILNPHYPIREKSAPIQVMGAKFAACVDALRIPRGESWHGLCNSRG